jgi:hypothetical protein
MGVRAVVSKRVTDTIVFEFTAFATVRREDRRRHVGRSQDQHGGVAQRGVPLRPRTGNGRIQDRCVMRLKVDEGWEPGIPWEGTTYPPGERFDIDEDDAAQFLANGSAVEAPAKAKRGAAK